MARLFADENVSSHVVAALIGFGHEVLTVADIGRANQSWPDPEVLAFAISEQRAVLTLNRRDFFRLHRQNPAHFGIIACTNDPDSAALSLRIHAAIEANPDLSNQLVRIVRPG